MPHKRRSSLQAAQVRRTVVHKKILQAQAAKRAAQSRGKLGGTFFPAGFTKKGATRRFDKAAKNQTRYAKEAKVLDKRIKQLGGKRRFR